MQNQFMTGSITFPLRPIGILRFSSISFFRNLQLTTTPQTITSDIHSNSNIVEIVDDWFSGTKSSIRQIHKPTAIFYDVTYSFTKIMNIKILSLQSLVFIEYQKKRVGCRLDLSLEIEY